MTVQARELVPDDRVPNERRFIVTGCKTTEDAFRAPGLPKPREPISKKSPAVTCKQIKYEWEQGGRVLAVAQYEQPA